MSQDVYLFDVNKKDVSQKICSAWTQKFIKDYFKNKINEPFLENEVLISALNLVDRFINNKDSSVEIGFNCFIESLRKGKSYKDIRQSCIDSITHSKSASLSNDNNNNKQESNEKTGLNKYVPLANDQNKNKQESDEKTNLDKTDVNANFSQLKEWLDKNDSSYEINIGDIKEKPYALAKTVPCNKYVLRISIDDNALNIKFGGLYIQRNVGSFEIFDKENANDIKMKHTGSSSSLTSNEYGNIEFEPEDIDTKKELIASRLPFGTRTWVFKKKQVNVTVELEPTKWQTIINQKFFANYNEISSQHQTFDGRPIALAITLLHEIICHAFIRIHYRRLTWPNGSDKPESGSALEKALSDGDFMLSVHIKSKMFGPFLMWVPAPGLSNLDSLCILKEEYYQRINSILDFQWRTFVPKASETKQIHKFPNGYGYVDATSTREVIITDISLKHGALYHPIIAMLMDKTATNDFTHDDIINMFGSQLQFLARQDDNSTDNENNDGND